MPEHCGCGPGGVHGPGSGNRSGTGGARDVDCVHGMERGHGHNGDDHAHAGHDAHGKTQAGGAVHASGPHGHGGHGHGAHGNTRQIGRRGLKIVLALTAVFMVAEFIGGLVSNSLALLADAGHMLTDVAALALSLFAFYFARRPATQEKTYGYFRIEILAALLNGVALTIIALGIFYEAWRRFQSPAPVDGGLMLAVAVLGLGVNVIAARFLHGAAGHNLNVRGAYLHVLGDLMGSVAAVVAAVVILGTGWTPVDPIASVIVAMLILAASWQLIRESVDVLLEAVPAHIEMTEVRDAIDDIPGVDQIHDLHVWTVTSGFLAMSGHAVVEDPHDHQRILEEVHERMRDRFGIQHVTIQLEREALYAREREHF